MSFNKHWADSPWRKRRKTEEDFDVLDYKTSLRFHSWEIERQLADKIMNHVKKNNLNFKLDNLTRGKGNCFMIAVLQQLQQIQIYQASSQQVKTLADGFSHMVFRQEINKFIKQSSD